MRSQRLVVGPILDLETIRTAIGDVVQMLNRVVEDMRALENELARIERRLGV